MVETVRSNVFECWAEGLNTEETQERVHALTGTFLSTRQIDSLFAGFEIRHGHHLFDEQDEDVEALW